MLKMIDKCQHSRKPERICMHARKMFAAVRRKEREQFYLLKFTLRIFFYLLVCLTSLLVLMCEQQTVFSPIKTDGYRLITIVYSPLGIAERNFNKIVMYSERIDFSLNTSLRNN